MRPLLLNDIVICTCGCKKVPKCPDGRIISAANYTFINGRRVARVGDYASNCQRSCCRSPNRIATGCSRTFVEGKNVANHNSRIFCGKPISSCFNTFVY